MSERKKLRNIGPVSSAWLADVGVHSKDDLQRIGSVEAYALIARKQDGVSLNLLWALEGALQDVDWRELPAESKEKLRTELEQMLR